MPEIIQNYSKIAAEQFIQTAVFIDDLNYPSRDENEADAVSEPPRREPAIDGANTADAANNDGTEIADFVPQEEIVYDIVNSFATKRIVCSIYEPKDGNWDTQTSNILNLCSAADVVILDWVFWGEIPGTRACQIIDDIINQAVDDTPEQLRLVLIYTLMSDLLSVANKIRDAVAHIPDNCEPSEDDGKFALQMENFRVVVLGKPTSARTDGVPANHLADVAIQEFAKLAQGLLQAAILLGLTEIRNNSRKILSRFDHRLDPAFLTHLAMTSPQEDASSHIIPLIGTEVEAILEDALPTRLIKKRWLDDWCKNVWRPGDHLHEIFEQQNLNQTQIDKLELREIAADICNLGFAAARTRSRIDNSHISPIPDIGKLRNALKASKMLLPSNESKANELLAQLMISRTFYSKKRRKKALKLGCILSDESDQRYFMCIQPICDSVRIKKRSVFIFVEMKIANSAEESRISHIIFKDDGSVLKLLYDPKPEFCYTATFESNSKSNQVIAKKENGKLYFEDTDSRKYYWKDQIRASHAQRAVEQFARQLSRVGLTESEWARRLNEGR